MEEGEKEMMLTLSQREAWGKERGGKEVRSPNLGCNEMHFPAHVQSTGSPHRPLHAGG